MAYKYVAYTSEGQLIGGTIHVEDEGAAERALERSGHRIISLRPVTVSPSINIKQLMPSLFGIKAQAVIAFSRQLATLIDCGTAILPALQLLREQMANNRFKKIVSELIKDLSQGNSLSEAISRQPQAFPSLYCKMIEVGEQTGALDESLRQIARHLEKERAVVKKMSQAMLYPAMLLLLSVGIVILLITVALPALMNMFSQMNMELPLPTRILMAIANFVSAYILQLFLLGVVIVLSAAWYIGRPTGREKIDQLLLRIPLIGPIGLLGDMSRFCRTMSLLLRAGLPLPEIMDIVQRTARNRAVRSALRDVKRELLQGGGLAGPMSQIRHFPRLLVQMVKVGEETGTLESNLAALADSYESEVDERLTGLTSMIGPVMTIVIALGVGFISISVILPMYSMLGGMP